MVQHSIRQLYLSKYYQYLECGWVDATYLNKKIWTERTIEILYEDNYIRMVCGMINSHRQQDAVNVGTLLDILKCAI